MASGSLIWWVWCTPEVVLGLVSAGVVGFIGWLIGEQAGWEEGYWQGLEDRRAEEEDEIGDEFAED